MKKREHRSIGLATALVALLALAVSAPLQAQRFQYIYGCPCDAEAGRRGVAPVTDGGYISVGESFTVLNPPDIYVVRTEDDGTLAWSYTYDVGSHDSATDVEEIQMKTIITRWDTVIVDGVPTWVEIQEEKWVNDGFIITGVTKWEPETLDDWGQPSGRTDRDLFLLRIDRCGVVMWFKTYGTDTTDEIGYDLQVALFGDSVNTNFQDIIVAGTTTRKSLAGVGPRDGYLLRTTINGNIIWDRTYDIDSAGKDDYFYGLTEAEALKPAGRAADIVAVGGTKALGGADVDMIIVRVDGGDGKIKAGRPHVAVTYDADGEDDLRAVRELRQAPHGGELAFVGRSTSFDNGFNDIFLMRTAPNPLAPFVQHVYGEAEEDDEGYDLVEIWNGPSYNRGNILLTGYATLDGGLGAKDAFLLMVTPLTLNPATKMYLYGGEYDDWGWSVWTVGARAKNGNNCSTDGFVMGGFTESDLKGTTDPRQLYLVKTNTQFVSGCHEDSLDVPHIEALLDFNDKRVHYDSIRLSYMPPIERTCQEWFDTLCLNLDGTMPCPIPPCPQCEQAPNPDDTNAVAKPNRGVPEIADGSSGALGTYPNPIHRGSVLRVRTALDAGTTLNLRVVDITGREVYAAASIHPAGDVTIPVRTAGWPVGSYVVTLEGGGRTVSARIVVIEH